MGDTLVEHVADLVFVFNFDGLLLACGRVGDVDFHGGVFFVVLTSLLFLKMRLERVS